VRSFRVHQRRDAAQHHLAQVHDASAAPVLRETVANNPNASARLHALLALQGMGVMDRPTWSLGAKDPDPAVSMAAARLSDQFLTTSNREIVLNDFMRVIKSSDVSSDLQLGILLALGSTPRRDTVPVLSELVARGIHSDFHLHALMSAVPGLELEVLQKLIADPRCGATASHEQVMRALASAVAVEGLPQRVARAVEMAAQQSYANSRTTLAVLNGMIAGSDSAKEDPAARTKKLSMVREEAWITLNHCSNQDVRERALQLRSAVH
jgi:hypothetical protein